MLESEEVDDDEDEKLAVAVVVVVEVVVGVAVADGVGPAFAHEVGDCGNEEWEEKGHEHAVWRQRSEQETDGKEELIQQTSRCYFHCCCDHVHDHVHGYDCDCESGCCSWKKEKWFERKSGRLGLERSDEEKTKRKSRKEIAVVAVGDDGGIEGSNRRGESGWRRGRTEEGNQRWRR